ncbi:hypothetical protein [Bradyrhizobium sp.]|uniref:hypothetical protein n=1 Tax=Bradyrhizobium sp. TaxID=376 RepID=UPI0012E896F8|nr:hypothetical protein [Bradyrhizobium sp.]
MADDKELTKRKGRLATSIAAVVAAVGVLAALLTNIKTIADFFEPLFSAAKTEKAAPPSPTLQPSPPLHKVTRVCMGNGGGNNCSSGANAQFDCNAYKAMGGGGQKTTDELASRFCGYVENGVHKIYPNTVTVYQNNGGGECGWTGFEVTCN